MTDPQDDKAAIISRFGPRLDGTCDWIIRKEEYQSWVGDERSSLLWISGGPATGKTYISLFLTSHLEEAVNNASKSSYGKRNELLAYYFCSQQDERCNTAITLLRGLMHLVLQARPNLVDSMLEDFCRLKNHNSLFDPSNKEALWRNFERMLLPSQLDKVYFVVDALDECAEESLDWLLQKLTGLVSVESAKRGPTLKVVITSRAYPEVLQHRLWKFGTITVGQHHNSNHDLRLFISSKIKDLAEKKSSKEGQRRAIVNDEWLKTTKKLMEYTDETFLWFSFVIRDLERCSLSEVEQTLRKLPRGLDRYYDRMIHQFSSLDQPKLEIAARVIRWVAMAVRPLSLLELSIAVDAPRIDYLSREQAMKDIVDQCGYFLKVDHGVVSLIHKSARDYLTSISAASGEHVSNLFRIDEGKAHLEIARACIRHIQGDPKGTSPFMTGRTINLGRGQPDVQCAEMQEFPLLQYAGLHWPEHARCCSEDEVIFDLSVPFFHEQSLVRRAWLHSYWRATMPDWELPGESFGLIHMYAFFGLKSATKELLRQPWPYKYMLTRMANRKSDREMTPLHWAVRNGHENVTKLLLDHGADVDTYGYGLTPLIWAVRNGNKAIVQILLEKAKIDQKGYGMTALHWAALEGRESLLRLLLGRGADSHARTTSQHLDGTFEMVTAESNGEFPWATVEQANLLSRSTKEEDDLLKGKRNVKENLSNGAGALAYVPSYLILFTHVTKPPLLPPPMVWTWSLATTMLVGVVTATAIQGLYFLLWYLSVQGCVILFWTLVYWYCDALQFPYWTAAQSAKCIFSWDHTYHLAFRYLVNFAFHFGILITVQRFNSWVGSYNWTWRPFIVLWWAGCTALAYLDLPLHLLAWATIGFTVAFWGEAILGALNKHPPLGKTAAELAAPRGFVGIVQLLGEREKKHYSFKR
jgi:hypothetical protein